MRKLNRSCLQLTAGLAAVLLLAPMCDAAPQPQIRKQPFGSTAKKEMVDLYTLTNAHGVEAGIITYGGIVVSLKVPDRAGKLQEVTLG
ncbi:MAG TPA: hypothetical protein VHP35_08030 [Terriglobia bacterium]|nr:hypothetical protein [Terriglobia bacterium]